MPKEGADGMRAGLKMQQCQTVKTGRVGLKAGSQLRAKHWSEKEKEAAKRGAWRDAGEHKHMAVHGHTRAKTHGCKHEDGSHMRMLLIPPEAERMLLSCPNIAASYPLLTLGQPQREPHTWQQPTPNVGLCR